MRRLLPDKVVARSRSWRRFFLLLGMFLAALYGPALLPLGGWSEVRSRWLNAAAMVVVCVIFAIAAVCAFWKGGSLSGMQTTLLCLISGFFLVLAAQEIYADMLFLQELRNRRSPSHTGVPNELNEPMRGSSVRLVTHSAVCGALPLVAHPWHSTTYILERRR